MRVYVGTYTGGASRGICLPLDPTGPRAASAPVRCSPGRRRTRRSSLSTRTGDSSLRRERAENLRGEGDRGGERVRRQTPATGLLVVNRQPSEGDRSLPTWWFEPGPERPPRGQLRRDGHGPSPRNRQAASSPPRPRPARDRVRSRCPGHQEGPHAHQVLLNQQGASHRVDEPGSGPGLLSLFDAASRGAEPKRLGRRRPRAGLRGPRHLAWHPSRAAPVWNLSELSATVSVALGFDASSGSLEILQTVPTRARRSLRGEHRGREPALPTGVSSPPPIAGTTTSPSSRSTRPRCGLAARGACCPSGGRGPRELRDRRFGTFGSSRQTRARVLLIHLPP